MRVHPELLEAESVPGGAADGPKFWKHRFHSITEMEKHLHRSGTHVVKFFLHLSREEQRRRFLARIDDPDKNWKFSSADIAERQLWKQSRPPTPTASPPPAPTSRPGTWSPPTTRTTPA